MPRRRRGAKGKGLSYERKGQALLKARFGGHCGQWFEFIDAGGHGYAQPDYFLLTPASVLVVEFKLTQTIAGVLQIQELYSPILRYLFHKPVVGVLACRNLHTDPGDRLITGPEAILGNTLEQVWTWHWLGEKHG